MEYSPAPEDPVRTALEKVIRGLGMVLVELALTPRGKNHQGAVQVRAVVAKPGLTGIEDCARAHRAILPRLELAFPGEELSVEVSSPGTGRNIKNAAEFSLWTGRGLRCYRSDTGQWESGLLRSAGTASLCLETEGGLVDLDYGIIARAKLDPSSDKPV